MRVYVRARRRGERGDPPAAQNRFRHAWRLRGEDCGGEAGKGVDFQKIGIVGGIQHDVDSGQIARADGVVGAAGQFAAVLDDLGGRPVSKRCSVSVE